MCKTLQSMTSSSLVSSVLLAIIQFFLPRLAVDNDSSLPFPGGSLEQRRKQSNVNLSVFTGSSNTRVT